MAEPGTVSEVAAAGEAVPPGGAGARRIADAFARRSGAAALMPYLMAGFPTGEGAADIGRAYAYEGADLVELGLPFSDPLADGPVIHAAGTRALANGTRLADALALCEGLAADLPVVVMGYVNLVLARGAQAFARALVDAGASGLIVPDLPLEESDEVRAACDEAGLALVPLVAPTSSPERLEAIARRARGFVYAVSVVGTTGERTSLCDHVEPLVERVKAGSSVPVALGFGISTPDHAAAAAAAGADGVIVASRLMREAADATDPGAAVAPLVRGFREALG
ncbi:MAG: tryptophan synthase subunit alpha [Solirubrobacteraceae bacterium MAG38_C4-C5]|nr:tryptophan synthase subunit alpha [Candidatus Siliceabacter maunaloa]